MCRFSDPWRGRWGFSAAVFFGSDAHPEAIDATAATTMAAIQVRVTVIVGSSSFRFLPNHSPAGVMAANAPVATKSIRRVLKEIGIAPTPRTAPGPEPGPAQVAVSQVHPIRMP